MTRALALICVLALSACIPGVLDATRPVLTYRIAGEDVSVQQKRRVPVMIAAADATGTQEWVRSGKTAPTVVVSGTADFAKAVRALARFCDRRDLRAASFDTQPVFFDAATASWWFDGFDCE